MFGDLGADNPKAFPRLRRDTQQGMYDAVLHVGEALARLRPEARRGAWEGGEPGAVEGTVLGLVWF